MKFVLKIILNFLLNDTNNKNINIIVVNKLNINVRKKPNNKKHF